MKEREWRRREVTKSKNHNSSLQQMIHTDQKWTNLRKRPSIFYIIDLLLAISTLFSHLRRVSAAIDDDSVMSKLAKSISPIPTGWTGPDPCRWNGVTCDSAGRVSGINLPAKSISGVLPADLNRLSNLKYLYLQSNKLSGRLPSLSNLTSLEKVNLDHNNFTSVPPNFISGLTSLQEFSIIGNPSLRPWTIPQNLTDSSSLVTFRASECGLTGTIPDIFESLPNLKTIRLSYNNLTGSLPPSLSKTGIAYLFLNNQLEGLSGSLDVLSTMSELNQAWLHINKFSGPIPDLSQCTSLFDLQLRGNLLTGVIPPSLSSLPKLTTMSLNNNVFQGPFPTFPDHIQVILGDKNSFCNPEPGSCDPRVTNLLNVVQALDYPMTLAEKWKGNDPCKAWTSISCDMKGSVTVINFSNRNWEGTISSAIANLTGLKTVLLNNNKLNGSIPSSLTSLSHLQLLDVSNNNLSGIIPDFDPRVTVKTSGNPFLGKDLNSKMPVITGVVIVAMVPAMALTFVIYKRKKRQPLINEDDDMDPQGGVHGQVDYIQPYDGGHVTIPIEILRKATNNFHENNILGKGGFGVVYRGKLLDGTEIAVKRMEANVMSRKGMNEFKAEIEVLTRVRHRNLVALNGFCVNGNERLLVYEYMSKGTLARYLYGDCRITWKERLGIALDVARGVEYLHNLAQQSFVHRDLKPENILLGEGMRAKVSDFGLVRNAYDPDGKCSVETRLAGTFGYLAPEYAATGRVTTKIDVFAYGVILMEIITGRKALDDSLPEDESQLVAWFREVIMNNESIKSYIDPSLNPDEETLDSIAKVAELAVQCTAREPLNRPDMSHVVNVLCPMVQQWKPSSIDEEPAFGIDYGMSLTQALQKWKAEATTERYSSSSFTYTNMPGNTTETF